MPMLRKKRHQSLKSLTSSVVKVPITRTRQSSCILRQKSHSNHSLHSNHSFHSNQLEINNSICISTETKTNACTPDIWRRNARVASVSRRSVARVASLYSGLEMADGIWLDEDSIMHYAASLEVQVLQFTPFHVGYRVSVSYFRILFLKTHTSFGIIPENTYFCRYFIRLSKDDYVGGYHA